ncbi:MAG: hypothetical protein WC381_01470 [Kiritimatiellia bacterium]
MNQADVKVLRELGKKVAEAAALDVNAATIAMWKRLNALKPVRPLIMLDQLPWNELNNTGELTLHCANDFMRSIECDLRQRLYKFNHFRGDMVMHNRVEIPRLVRTQPALAPVEQTLATDSANSVVAHAYTDQIPDEKALDSIPMPVMTVDEAGDRKRIEIAAGIFDGILTARLVGPAWGYSMYGGLWDQITVLRGAEKVLYDLIDRPEFSHKVIAKFVKIWNSLADQYEALGLFDVGAPLVHCTGAYTDELPSKQYDGKNAKARDVWIFGLAQVFSTVSPAMHDEFEIEPVKPLLERFGLAYYGCCDPMDRKIDIVRKIKNVRKISMSPWADAERGASQMAGDFVFSAKPNPAFVATDRFDESLVRKELRHIVATCRKYKTPCELILKDVSTVKYQPQRLVIWERIAKEVANEA